MDAPAAKLRRLLEKPGLRVMPCCFDALSAKLVERAGFELTFMSGFAVSASRLALPDTGLISYGEMVEQGRGICAAVSIPVIGDGDTGYGNPMNVRRTVARLRRGRLRERDDRGPARAQALRAHARQAGGLARGGADARARRGRRARAGRGRADPGADRRARAASGSTRPSGADAPSPISAPTSCSWRRPAPRPRCSASAGRSRLPSSPIWSRAATRRCSRRRASKRSASGSPPIR